MVDKRKLSGKMCLILRHKPQQFGLHVDENGWCNLSQLSKALKTDIDTIKSICDSDDKDRYEIDYSGKNTKDNRIRCLHGHSLPHVIVHRTVVEPPDHLWHSTSWHALGSIMQQGLAPMSRNWVHLTDDLKQALEVGKRHQKTGEPALLKIKCKLMYANGVKFYKSGSKIWLVEKVQTQYITVLNKENEQY